MDTLYGIQLGISHKKYLVPKESRVNCLKIVPIALQ